LCYLLTAIAVLPRTLNGKEEVVVWLDTDGGFSAKRMQVVLLNFISAHSTRSNHEENIASSYEALRHIHVFRLQSSSQLVSTLEYLAEYLLNYHGDLPSFSGSRCLGMVVLDSTTAFTWQERLEMEVARFEAMGVDGKVDLNRLRPRYGVFEVVNALKKLQKLFDCVVIFTTIPYTRTTNMDNTFARTSDGRHLPPESPGWSAWTAFATLSLTMTSVKVPQFAAQMSLQECERDQPNRLAAISKGCFVVSVDQTHSESWGNDLREAVNLLHGHGNFGVRINSNGVVIED
jgi:hypothetical protein